MMTPGARHDPRGPFVKLFVNRWVPALSNYGFSSQRSGAMLLTSAVKVVPQNDPMPDPPVTTTPSNTSTKTYYLDGGTGLVRIMPYQMNDTWWRSVSAAADGGLSYSDFQWKTSDEGGDTSQLIKEMPGIRQPPVMYPYSPWFTSNPILNVTLYKLYYFENALTSKERLFRDQFNNDPSFSMHDFLTYGSMSDDPDIMEWIGRTNEPLRENEGIAVRFTKPDPDVGGGLVSGQAFFFMIGDNTVIEVDAGHIAVYSFVDGAWYPIQKWEAQQAPNMKAAYTVAIIPQAKDCISIWRSTSFSGQSNSPSTELGGEWMTFRMSSNKKTAGIPYWNTEESHWVKTPAAKMVIGVKAVRALNVAGVQPFHDSTHIGVAPFAIQLSRVRYNPAPQYQITTPQELVDPLTLTATNLVLRGEVFNNPSRDVNSLRVDVSAVDGRTLDPVVVGETYDSLAIKWRLLPTFPYSPELVWVEMESPATLFEEPAEHKEYTCTQQWTMIRFKRSAEDLICKAEVKIIGQPDGVDSEGQPTYKLNEDNIFQCLTTAEVTIARSDSEGSGALLIDHDWAATLHIEERNPVIKNGQMFDILDSFDMIKRLEDASMGNIKVLNNITVEQLILYMFTRAGVYKTQVYIHRNLRSMPIMGTQVPGEFINTIASRSPLSALKSIIEKLIPYIRVRQKKGVFPSGYLLDDGVTDMTGQEYMFEIYLRPGYRDTEAQQALLWRMYDINEVIDPENGELISGGIDRTDYWHRTPRRILKTRDVIEYSVRGAKFHRLEGSSTCKPSESDNKKITSIFNRTNKFWEDPADIDYEMGFRKTLSESSPDLWMATQSELDRYVTMRGARESFPIRTCQFPGEFHPDVWPDDFFRIYTKIKPSKELLTVADWHRWSYNMGIWRILDMDVTILGDAPHRWTCKYTCEWEGFYDDERPISKEIRL